MILLTCKAYDLESALDAIAPAVGDHTLILPLLNGMRHVDVLAEHFGRGNVLGGHCVITATLDPAGRVLHLPGLRGLDLLGFGELDGGITPRVQAVEQELAGAGFQVRASENELQEMWEKWIGLAVGASMTCLMRGAIGDIVEAGGADLSLALMAETLAIAAASGHAPGPEFVADSEPHVTDPRSQLTSSLLRDVEHGKRVEADAILGDLLGRAPDRDPRSLLRIAYVHLKTYEARRAREGATHDGRGVAAGVGSSEDGAEAGVRESRTPV